MNKEELEALADMPPQPELTEEQVDELARLDAMRHPGTWEL